MDPKEYDRIADLLIQIQKKYINLPQKDNTAPLDAVKLITQLIELNDHIGWLDGKGWL